jgi:hypothetical protein
MGFAHLLTLLPTFTTLLPRYSDPEYEDVDNAVCAIHVRWLYRTVSIANPSPQPTTRSAASTRPTATAGPLCAGAILGPVMAGHTVRTTAYAGTGAVGCRTWDPDPFPAPLRPSRPSVFLTITPISQFPPPASLAPYYAAIHLLVLTSSDNNFDGFVFIVTIATVTGGIICRDRTFSLNPK